MENKKFNISNRKVIAFALFVVSLALFMLCNNHTFNNYNNYSYLADAIIHGHIDVPDIPEHLEYVSFMGHNYMHFAPGCAWISIPFVLIFGRDGFNCIYLAMVLGALNSALAYIILDQRKIGKRIRDRIILALMLTIGTVHFFCSSIGSSWFLGHVSTLFFILLSWYFIFKIKSADEKGNFINLFISGLFFGLAVNCRLSALFGGLFLAYYIFKIYRFNLKPYISFAIGAAVFGSIYMIYNYARFGTIMDQGYALTYLKDYHREAYDTLLNSPLSEQKQLLKQYSKEFGGPLQIKFIKYNLYSIFMMAPTFSGDFPYIIPEVTGVALTFTSPMLFLAVTAKKHKDMVIVLWITTFLTAMPFLLNYGNGTAQFGMRYSLDFTPYLWLLMCNGLGRKKLTWWMNLGFAFCFISNIYGTLYWRFNY